MTTDKLTTEFDGLEYRSDLDLNGWYNKDGKLIHETLSGGTQYHTSWQWLMPVVKKINDAPGLSIAATVKKTELVMDVWNAVHVVDIEAAHKAAVRFIEWYNEQEKNLKPFNRDWEINPDSELFKLEKDNVGTGGNWHT